MDFRTLNTVYISVDYMRNNVRNKAKPKDEGMGPQKNSIHSQSLFMYRRFPPRCDITSS